MARPVAQPIYQAQPVAQPVARPIYPTQPVAMGIDTTGDGVQDSVVVDTTGDGVADSIVPNPAMQPPVQEVPAQTWSPRGDGTLMVEVPAGKKAGDLFTAMMPDGNVASVTVPDGMGPGMAFELKM